MADYDIGRARGRIEITASDIGRAISALDVLGNRMLLIGGLAAAGFGYAVKSAADFEEQMSRFGAVTNAPEKQMDAIRKKALQLGRDSAYGATEVVKSFAELAYAGASTQEVIGGLGDAVVYLAAAAEIPLASAATTLINTMRQFNIPASGAVDIANQLARAANASTITMDDLITSLRYAGPVAASMGISFNDTAQALAILGNEGIRGSTAGTSLRGVMLGLLATTPKARGALHDLGLDTNEVGNNFFDASGKMRSLKDISEILHGSLGHLADQVFNTDGTLKTHAQIQDLLSSSTLNLSDKTKLQAFSSLFQRRAMASALVLAKDGAGAFDKLTSSQQYNTTAQELMRKKLDNVKGSLKKLGASAETFGITLGEHFQKPMQDASDALRDVTNWFARLDPKVQDAIGYFLFFSAVALLGGGALLKIGGAALRMYKAMKDLTIAIQIFNVAAWEMAAALLANPITWIVLAVLLLAAAVYFLWTNWDKVWGWIMHHKAYAAILALLFPFLALFVAIVGGAKWLYDNWDKVWAGIKRVANSVLKWLNQAFQDAKTWVKEAIDNVVEFFEKLPGRIKRGLETAAEEVSNFAQHLPETIANLAAGGLHWLTQLAINIIQGLVDGFVQALPIVSAWVLNFPAWLVGVFGDVSTWLLDVGFKILNGLWIGMTQVLPNILSWWIGTAFPAIIGLFGDASVWLLQAGKDVIQGLWNGAYAIFIGVLDWLGGFSESMVSAVGTLIGSLFSNGWDFIAGLFRGITQAAFGVIGWLIGLPQQLVEAVGHLADKLYDKGWNFIKGLLQGMQDMGQRVLDWAGGFASDVASKIGGFLGIGSPSRITRQYGKWVMEGLQIGLDEGQAGVKAQLAKLAPLMKPFDVSLMNATAGGVSNVAASTTPVNGPSRTTQINNDNKFYVMNAQEAARAVMRETSWQERTVSGGVV